MREVGQSRRSREIRITPAGMEKIRQAAPLWMEAQQVFLSILGKENISVFEDLLERTARIKDIDLDQAKKSQQAAA